MKEFDLPEFRREISVLNAHIQRFDGRLLNRLDLSVSQAKIIFLLSTSNRAEIYHKDVDACLGMTHSTTSGILSRMQAKGLIEHRPGKTDKRRKQLILTEKGKQAYAAFIDDSTNLQDKLLDGISQEQLEITCRTLLAMIKNMK